VRLAERQGELLVAVIEQLLRGLDGLVRGGLQALDPADPRVRAVVHESLLAVEGGQG
jgi:hypothetical protein